jgi:hypothetical protein
MDDGIPMGTMVAPDMTILLQRTVSRKTDIGWWRSQMTNDFDEFELRRLGFSVAKATAEHILLVDTASENEIMLWRLGGWLQFRCAVYELGSSVGSSKYIALSETLNRMHDVALGARLSLSDSGDIVLVADLLHSTVNTEVAVTISKQLLFLAERLIEPIEEISRGRSSFSVEEIDRILS